MSNVIRLHNYTSTAVRPQVTPLDKPAETATVVELPVRNHPVRPPNAELRIREYLTKDEVETLMDWVRGHNDFGHRDATMILTAYRHGLRVSELCDLRWDQIDFTHATMAVRRLKNGSPSTQPIMGDELRALRRLQRDPLETKIKKTDKRKILKSPYVFLTKRKGPFTPNGFAKMISRARERCGMEIKAHPHMLRHACGFTLANNGQDTRALQGYLGHKNIQHTVRYTELAAGRFKDFWRD
jgi:site-specific recombinase XerD